jgi:hypothetical protein
MMRELVPMGPANMDKDRSALLSHHLSQCFLHSFTFCVVLGQFVFSGVYGRLDGKREQGDVFAAMDTRYYFIVRHLQPGHVSRSICTGVFGMRSSLSSEREVIGDLGFWTDLQNCF